MRVKNERAAAPAILFVSDSVWFSDDTNLDNLPTWFGATCGISTSTFEEAGMALKALDAGGTPLAVCLVDIPDNPSEVAGFLDRLNADYPFALKAALIDEEQRPWAIGALEREQIDRFVVKGSTPDQVREAVETLLERFHTLCRLHAAVNGRLGKHVFVTGATGFLGTRFVREMLRCSDVKVTCLTRNCGTTPYDRRLPFTAADYPGRLEFFCGDVMEPNLGLSPSQLAYLEDSVDEIWHLAAITAFSEKMRNKILDANVLGTTAVISFAKKLKHLKVFNHVSTAYVAGYQTYPEIIPEKITTSPPKFKNPYEESKWYAEQILSRSGLPYLVYRPSILIGESYSGRSDDKTWYGAAKVVHIAKSMACDDCELCTDAAKNSFRLTGASNATLNVIPVDWVVDQFLRLRACNPALGSVFHTVHPKPVKVDDLMRGIAEALEIKHWQFVQEHELNDPCWAEAIMLKGFRVLRDYMLMDDPVFDQTKARAYLYNVDCPSLEPDFLRFCVQSFYEQKAASWSSAPRVQSSTAAAAV